MTRSWGACEFELQGIRFRVVRGNKQARHGDHIDHRIDWWASGDWQPLELETVGVVVDFLMWNEEGLYPPGGKPRLLGGEKVLRYLRLAYKYDIDYAERVLKQEQAEKLAHLFDPDDVVQFNGHHEPRDSWRRYQH